MKDRIAHIMRAKNLKASDFAELLGIQPSGISHILSGRNQPSLDFIKKIKETFPEYNLDWIIFGKGPMTTSEPYREIFTPQPSTTPDLNFLPEPDPTPNDLPAEPSILKPSESTPEHIGLSPDVNAPTTESIKNILVLFNDGTFETYSPR